MAKCGCPKGACKCGMKGMSKGSMPAAPIPSMNKGGKVKPGKGK